MCCTGAALPQASATSRAHLQAGAALGLLNAHGLLLGGCVGVKGAGLVCKDLQRDTNELCAKLERAVQDSSVAYPMIWVAQVLQQQAAAQAGQWMAEGGRGWAVQGGSPEVNGEIPHKVV